MYTVLHRIIPFMFSVFFIAGIALNAQEPQVPITLFLDANEAELTPEQSIFLSRIRSQATTKAARLVRVKSWENIEQLVNTDAIQINLFPGVQFVADKTRIESWDMNEYSWIGKPRNGPEMGEYVILSFIKEHLSGIIWVNSTLYGVSSLGSNILVVMELDQSKSLPEHPPGFESGAMIDSSAPLGSPEGAGSSPNSLGKVAAVQSNPNYDLMVVYTDQALSAATAADSSMNTLILAAVAQANTVYNNSGDGVRTNLPDVSLVYKGPVGSYTEDPDMAVNLNRLKNPSDNYMDNVHDLRDQYGADVVVLLTHTGQYKGLAYMVGAYASTAFAVVKWDQLWYYTLTHEIGHLFGSRHDDDPENDPYPYGHAFVNMAGDAYQTVVASKGAGTMDRIPYLSNPTKDPYGVYIGSASWRDNTMVHHVRSDAVAGFKPPLITVNITGPSHLQFKQWGTFTANVSGGSGTISYQWYKKEGSGSWQTRGTAQTQSERMSLWDITMKVVVTRGPSQAEDQHICYNSDLPKAIPPGAVEIPFEYALTANHPNPFNPATTIRYDLPEASRLTLVIYDIMGREVRRWDLQEEPGYRQVMWDGKYQNGQLAPTGLYIYRLVASSTESDELFTTSRKMLLMK